MAEDMIERATQAAWAVRCEYLSLENDYATMAEFQKTQARQTVVAALLAALDPEDEALQQLWGDVIDRFSDPASHHCMATFFAELKAMAQGGHDG